MSAPFNSPSSILARMHGMLESDSVGNEQEFSAMISVLHNRSDIPIERISSHLNIPNERIRDWMNGIAIPEAPFRGPVVRKVMSLIEEVLRERNYI